MMFPQRLQFKLCKCPGKKGDHLENIILKIGNLREQAQRLQLFVDASTPVASRDDDRLGPGTRKRCQGSGGSGHNVVRGFKNSKRYKKRRNCNMLENEKSKSKPFIEDRQIDNLIF